MRYFKTYTSNMGYLLGRMVGSGVIDSIDDQYRLLIYTDDARLLQFINDELDTIHTTIDHVKGYFSILITDRDILMDIMSYGILSVREDPVLPTIPRDIHINFIHGILDSIGIVWVDGHSNNSTLYTSFMANSKPFLQSIGGMLHDLIGSIPKIHSSMLYHPDSTSAYELVYATKESLGTYHMLYDNTHISSYYDTRKQAIYEKWLLNDMKNMYWGMRKCKLCGNMYVAFHDQSYRCWECRRSNGKSNNKDTNKDTNKPVKI